MRPEAFQVRKRAQFPIVCQLLRTRLTLLLPQFALRWRTEEEVLSGAGEETCGNTRCTFHEKPRALTMPPLNTLELPFAYEEHGECKSALVKVVLCGKCLKKLMWKREKEKEEMRRLEEGGSSQQDDGGRARLLVEDTEEGRSTYKRSRNEDEGDHNREHERSNCPDGHKRKSEGHKRRRSSRSRSPKHRHSKRYERENERRARSPRND